jgi:hypothetical protein
MSLLAFLFAACAAKSTSERLFVEDKPHVTISPSTHNGYVPLAVEFSAYLETKETTVEREITQVKWLITGPNGYEREITNDAENLQVEEENRQSFFYLEYAFNQPGRYTVQLILNEGQYSSRKVPINALERPREANSRF